MALMLFYASFVVFAVVCARFFFLLFILLHALWIKTFLGFWSPEAAKTFAVENVPFQRNQHHPISTITWAIIVNAKLPIQHTATVSTTCGSNRWCKFFRPTARNSCASARWYIQERCSPHSNAFQRELFRLNVPYTKDRQLFWFIFLIQSKLPFSWVFF